MRPTLDQLAALSAPDAHALFLKACGSDRWAALMTAARPFKGRHALLAAADRAEAALSRTDWLEAFSHHPRIGDAPPRHSPTRDLSSREQSGMAAASEQVRLAFLEGNAEYQRRFGHVFLICATGKSADEMLASLRTRLANDPAAELAIAMDQQRLITRLRLDKLLTLPQP